MTARDKPSPRRPSRKDLARTERRRRAADVRRRRTAAPTVAVLPDVAPPRRRRVAAIVGSVAALVAVAVAVVVVVVTRGGDDAKPTVAPTLTAPLAASQDDPWTLADPPSAYRIVYRRDQSGPSGTVTTTEEHTVRRPFESLLVSKAGAPPGGALQTTVIGDRGTVSQQQVEAPASSVPGTDTSTTVSSGDTSTTVAAPAEPVVYAGAPSIAYGDVRLDASLDGLVSSGFFRQQERRTLLGRDCQVFRTGRGLVSSGVALASDPPAKPTELDYADACIDASGLVLEQVVVEIGKVVSHVTATEVDTTVQPTDELFRITGVPAPTDQGGVVVTEVDGGDAPVPTYWVVGSTPAGFQLQGRYRMEQSHYDSSGAVVNNADGSPEIVATYADVYVQGTEAIVVRQGPTSIEPSTVGPDASTVRVGGLGTAQAAAALDGASLVAHPGNPGDWFVVIEATKTVDEIVQIARSMHTVEGTSAPVTAPTTAPTTGGAGG